MISYNEISEFFHQYRNKNRHCNLKMEQEQTIKIVLLGSAGVGKSSILKRYISDDFENREQPTLGASFHSKTVKMKDKSYKFQIWDTAGQEKYAPLAVMYYRDAHVVLLVYDTTCKDSFEVLKGWHEEVKEKGMSNVVMMVIGNKNDLIDRQEVEPERARAYADSIGAGFKLTSAKENSGIKEVFEKIIEKILQNQILAEEEKKGLKLKDDGTSNGANSEKKCC